MDTITLIRSAIRSLLRVASEELASELRGVLTSGDDHASNAKPQIDWDNSEGRAALIDSRARDGYACLLLLEGREVDAEKPKVYGDAAYGSGGFLEHLDKNGLDSGCKTQPPCNRDNLFPKSSFSVDLDGKTVTCPAGVIVPLSGSEDKDRIANFASACQTCGLRSQCTTSSIGRSIRVGPYERLLADARLLQQNPEWKADYQATRPKVERKIGHLMRRRHGGRRARVRGRGKVAADFSLLAAALNLARLASLGIRQTTLGWVAEMALTT